MEPDFETRKVYTCNHCGRPTFRRFSLDITLDGTDETDPDADVHHEWPYDLCGDCFHKWFDGRISTESLITTCNLNHEIRDLQQQLAAARK